MKLLRSKRKKEAWMTISSMVKGKGVITKIVEELGYFQDRKDCLIMQLLYVNQLVSALERKMGKIKRFPLILKLVLFIAV